MHPRLDPHVVAPEAMVPIVALEKSVTGSGLDHALIELVKIRASQINGCAYCLELHTRDARKLGETSIRLDVLAAWREAPHFSDRERVALAWTEALTSLEHTGAPDESFDPLREHFDEQEIVKLTVLIATINAWNRIAVGFRSTHGRGRN